MQNLRRYAPHVFALISVLALIAGPARSDMHAEGPTEDAASSLPAVIFQRANGGAVPLTVEVADTSELAQCGLMHRIFMPEDQGMLFVYAGRSGFWNRNTLIPLSVAYISGDGRIVDIIPMEATPFAGALGVSQPDPREPYDFVIEANAGWFERHGIVIGDFVDVAAAVARGSAGQPPPACHVLGY